MNVVNLSEHRNRDVAEVLRELLELAENRQIHGLAFVVKVGPGDNRAGLAGEYRRHPEKALKAAVLLERHLTDNEESWEPSSSAFL